MARFPSFAPWLLSGLVALSVFALVLSASDRGFWEPWESHLLIPQDSPVEPVEPAEPAEPAEPDETVDVTPEHFQILHTLSADPPSERSARAPLLLLALLLLALSTFWAYRSLGPATAAANLLVLSTTPAFFTGALILSGPLFALATSSMAILAMLLAHSSRGIQAPLWGLAAGIFAALTTLHMGLIGLFATLAPLAALALVLSLYDEEQRPSIPLLALTTAAALALIFFAARSEEPTLIHWILVPAILLLGTTLSARHTPIARTLLGPPGLLLVAGGALAATFLLFTGRANLPGLFFVPTPVEALPDELSFAWWWRQVGFALFPHVIFLLPSLGFLVYRLRDPEHRLIAALCLVWPPAAFAVIGPAVAFGHSLFPALFPFIFAIAWMISDRAFLTALRRHPATYLTFAITALFALQILSKDLENYPTRLMEPFLLGDEHFALPEDFAFSSSLKLFKNLYLLALLAYFAGAISWIAFLFQDLNLGRRRLLSWWQARRGLHSTLASPRHDGTLGTLDALPPGPRRAKLREDWRDTPGVFSRAAGFLERGPGLFLLVGLAGLSFAAIHTLSLTGDLHHRLSTGPVIQAYQTLAGPDEPLYRYQVPERDDFFYLRGLDELEERRHLQALIDQEDRIFALIPEDRLPTVFSTLRRSHQGFNLPVLAKSGGLLLISNQIRDHEEDLNPISPFLLDEPDPDMIPLQASFNQQVELIGYRLDRGSADERASYAWGDEIELTLYLRVLRRIPGNQRIFLHIDYPGNRIHGDHDPIAGLYPTNQWAPGDIIKNVHTVPIERFAAPGIYTVWMGFFRGNDRMPVTPEDAHDGQNRVEITKIEVSPF